MACCQTDRLIDIRMAGEEAQPMWPAISTSLLE